MNHLKDDKYAPSNPAFKGSQFTAEEYEEVWGEGWSRIFMHDPHRAIDKSTQALAD